MNKGFYGISKNRTYEAPTSASYALTAMSASYSSYASNVLGGTDGYIPLWSGSTALTSSLLYQSGSEVYSLSNFNINGSNKLLFDYIEVNGNQTFFNLDYLQAKSRTPDNGIVSIYSPSGSPSAIGYAFQFTTKETSGNGLLFVGHNSIQKHYIATDATSPSVGWPLVFRVAQTGQGWGSAADLMTLTPSQNVGIGTTSPSFKLDISGSGRFTNGLTVTGSISVQGNIIPGGPYTANTSSYNLGSPTAAWKDIYVSNGSLIFISGSASSSIKLGADGIVNLTGSLQGTASWAINAITSSYPISVTGSTLYSTNPAVGDGGTFSINNSIFLGDAAGRNATSASNSNFLGAAAGVSATRANNSNFFGQNAGNAATSASNSNFLGNSAGANATNAQQSNFLGNSAGSEAISAYYSNFLGASAGQGATNAYYSNFLGNNTGRGATNAFYSNFLGNEAGNSATDARVSNFIGSSAGFQATNAGYSNFLGSNAGYQATNAENSNFLGYQAGFQATNANNSNFLGAAAGSSATDARSSNFLGNGAGQGATGANNSNFIGETAGRGATNAFYSNFLGQSAGNVATNAYQSNFLGQGAGLAAVSASDSNFLGKDTGRNARNASNSNFIGNSAGANATNANQSNFIGTSAGNGASSASYSTLIGFQAGLNFTGTGISSNNIVIGTNITLANSRRDSINIGGIIFGTGSYFNTSSLVPFSGSANGRIGINVVTPTQALDVSGSVLISDVLVLPFQNPLPSGRPTGSVAISGSGGTFVGMFVYDGTSWTNVKA